MSPLTLIKIDPPGRGLLPGTPMSLGLASPWTEECVSASFQQEGAVCTQPAMLRVGQLCLIPGRDAFPALLPGGGQ